MSLVYEDTADFVGNFIQRRKMMFHMFQIDKCIQFHAEE